MAERISRNRHTAECTSERKLHTAHPVDDSMIYNSPSIRLFSRGRQDLPLPLPLPSCYERPDTQVRSKTNLFGELNVDRFTAVLHERL